MLISISSYHKTGALVKPLPSLVWGSRLINMASTGELRHQYRSKYTMVLKR